MKGYFKLPPLVPMSDSRTALRQLSDDDWKNYIFFHLFHYFNNVDFNEITTLINNEKEKSHSEIEALIKRNIRNFLRRKSKKFEEQGFKLNLEAEADSYQGYYDLKFEHSDWNKYFVFEAKNLGEIKSRQHSILINEYVYVSKNGKENGGMHRFMTKKYASEINFGGMLGFVVGKSKGDIINNLIEKIKLVYENKESGKLVNDKIILNSIMKNQNTFTSIHSRNGSFEDFYLNHIIMDFTK